MSNVDPYKILMFCGLLQEIFKCRWESHLSDWGEADVIFSSKKKTFFLYLEGEFIYRIRGRWKIKDLWLTQIWKNIKLSKSPRLEEETNATN